MSRFRALDHSNKWIRLCQVFLYPLTHLLGKRRYSGMERLNRPGGMIVVANHISHLDPVYDAVLIHKAGRVPHTLAKASLWKIPVVGRIIRGAEQIPVERGGGAGQAALEAAEQALADGKLVLVYPEGTVTREPEFWPMRPRPGVAAMALAGDYPVVPVVHWGTQAAYTSYGPNKGLHLFPRKEIKVVVGPDIDLSAYRGKAGDARAIRDVSMLIMNTITDMLAELRGEQAPAQLFDPKKAERLAKGGENKGGENSTSAGE